MDCELRGVRWHQPDLLGKLFDQRSVGSRKRSPAPVEAMASPAQWRASQIRRSCDGSGRAYAWPSFVSVARIGCGGRPPGLFGDYPLLHLLPQTGPSSRCFRNRVPVYVAARVRDCDYESRLSPWLLIFSMFTFLSLSLAKRYTEVQHLGDQNRVATPGRGYLIADAPLLLGLGTAASLGAVLILILYLIEDAFPRSFYANPEYLWTLPGILFLFFGRIWLVSQRKQLDDDPVEFALKDRQSLLLAAATLIAMAAAIA